MGRSTSLFVLIIQICSLCVVAEKFVSAGATGGDGSAGAPYGTIALGVNNAANGETVTVLPGNYTGTVTVSGRSNILIRSSLGSANTILKSSINVQLGSFGISIIGFSFINLGAPPILINGASTAYVQNCFFQGNFYSLGGGGVRIESNSNAVVEDSSFSSVGFTAVFGSNSNVTVRRCRFSNNLGDTILQGGVRSESGVLTVEDSTFTSNAGAIGFTSNKNQTISVKNTRFYNNSVTPIGFSVYCPDTTINLVQANNFFCSSPGGNLISCGGWTSTLVPVGPCNACYGEGTERDCAGVCFGGQTSNCPNTTRYYYVSPDGNSTNNGLSPKSPKGTIQAGINLASSGDVVIAMRGRYVGTGNVNLNFGGKAIKLMSEFGKPEDVTVDCRQTASTSAVVINSGETIDTIIQGITFTNCSSPIVTLSAGTAAKFKNCRFRDTGSGSVGPGIKVQDAYLILEDSEVKSTFGQGSVYISRQSGVAGAIIRNSRFLNTTGTSAGGAIYVGASCSIILENNLFFGNSAGTFNGGAVALEASSKLSLLNNSFTSNTAPVIACGNDFYTTQNNFCGPNGNNLISCGSYSPLLMTNIDVCGICGGTNATTDCSGTCWGPKVSDGSGGCCREYEKDCFGKCFGPAKYDCAGTCNGTKTLDTLNVCCETSDRDCLGFCFGGRENDTFGGCCFRAQIDCGKCFGSIERDCNGTCGGTQIYDNSTIRTPSHCCQRANFDCADYCFGDHAPDVASICCLRKDIDCANVCEGFSRYDNSSIRTADHCCLPIERDCADICNGGHVRDNSTSMVCCHYTEIDCYGFCYGPTATDRNGVCCNRTNIDCNRVCGGPSVNDSIGGCCLSTAKDCAGICNGNSTRDKNNVCCLESKMDCSRVCFGTKVNDTNGVCCDVVDNCNVCNGNNSCLTSGLTSGSTTGLIESPGEQQSSSTRDVTRWIILGIILFVVLLLILILIIVLLVVRKSKRKSETIEMQQAQIKTVEVKSAPISVNRDASASSSSSGDETEDTTPQSSKSSSSSD